MNTAAPDPSAPSDAAIAQAFRLTDWINRDADKFYEDVMNRAREIDASAPAAAVGGVVMTPAQEDDVARASREQLFSEREEVLRDYVDDYEYLGEDEAGREGCYRPNERERILIEDAIRGWESLEVAIDTPAAPVGGLVVVPREPTEAMVEAGKDARMECFRNPAMQVGRALELIYAAMIAASPAAQSSAKDGARVGETLPTWLLVLIGNYGFASANSTDVEKLHRWELLMDGIKKYRREATTGAGLVDEAACQRGFYKMAEKFPLTGKRDYDADMAAMREVLEAAIGREVP